MTYSGLSAYIFRSYKLKELSQDELDELVEIVEKYLEGASLQEILNMQNLQIHRRRLQRCLALLIKLGCIIVIGESRSSRYQLSQGKKKPGFNPEKSIKF